MKKRILDFVLKYSGVMLAMVTVVAKLTETSTCGGLFGQPKVPDALIENEN